MSAVNEENVKGYDVQSIYPWDLERTSKRNDNYLRFEG